MRRIRAENRYVPLAQLLRERVDAYTADSHARLTQLGTLFSYLLNWREDTRNEQGPGGELVAGPFAQYVRAMLNGQDSNAQPAHELITSGLEELESDYTSFGFQ